MIRHCEFARAALASLFDNSLPQLHYMGYVRKESFAKTQTALTSLVYEYWDTLEVAGPKTRPREDGGCAPPPLKVLAVASDGSLSWPSTLMDRFPEGSTERLALEKKKEAFGEQYPESLPKPGSGQQRSPSKGTQPRSGARPDFTIEGGALPVDPSRIVDLAGVKAADFTAERLLA